MLISETAADRRGGDCIKLQPVRRSAATESIVLFVPRAFLSVGALHGLTVQLF